MNMKQLRGGIIDAVNVSYPIFPRSFLQLILLLLLLLLFLLLLLLLLMLLLLLFLLLLNLSDKLD